MKIVLVVEDDIAISQFYRLILTKAGYDVVQAFSCLDAIDLFLAVFPDIVILDLALPDGDGLSILPYLTVRPEYIQKAVIVVSANADALERVTNAGIQRFFHKPISVNAILDAVEQGIIAVRSM